ncbi:MULTISPECIES: aroma-sacti cluster domain-containing protein [unclassified Streptomyces]|uniref:aroma-sacti cluster domain-containing protein n=1 Tax=unclassified Streptomyces TaxID=2593676 RepID=UPI000CD4C282|nr:aroma-sacti cluster domain-containing protein [Streptomyces sp. SM10]
MNRPHDPNGTPSGGEQPVLSAALYEAGLPVDLLSDEQRLVLSELTEEELAVLLDIKSRLDAVEPEVQAHGEIAGGALF